jgi:hypothetical protein
LNVLSDFVTPYQCGSFIGDSMPVYPGAFCMSCRLFPIWDRCLDRSRGHGREGTMSVPAPTRPTVDHGPQVEHWDAMREVSPAHFSDVRCRMVLDGCKWDPQVGDTATLATFPLVLPPSVALSLGELAERLTAEALDAEQVLLDRPESLRMLGLPRAIRRALARAIEPTPAAARVIRFDFHPTSDGWRISEANADVPGGYTESSLFPRLMADHCPGTRPVGDPAKALADAIVAAGGNSGHVGLLAATGHMEDQQVIAFLAGLLRQRGCSTTRAHPRQVIWDNGVALLATPARNPRPLDALVRVLPGRVVATRDGAAELRGVLPGRSYARL